MKRRYATLIELLVALCLTAMIVGALLVTYRQIYRVGYTADREIKKLRKAYALHSRLSRIFPETMCEEAFYTDDDGLFFAYNNGIDQDPLFSGRVLAHLHFEEGRLAITIGSTVEEQERTEILCSGLKRFAIEFYQPPHYREQIAPGWSCQWPVEYRELPALVKLHLDEQSLTFAICEADKPPRFLK